MQVGQKQLELGLGPFGEDLYASVESIAHPPRQSKPPRLVQGRGPIPHPLHAAMHHGVKATFLRSIRVGHDSGG